MAFKFDDLIAKVKAQIPPSLLGKFAPKGGAECQTEGTQSGNKTGTRGTATLTETNPDVHEKTHSGTQTKSKIDATGTDGKPPVDPKAAKRSKIIKIGVGIAIVFFAADEFLNTEQPAQTPSETVAVKKPKKEVPPVEQVQATPEPTAPPVQVSEVATPAPTPEVVATQAPQAEVTPEVTAVVESTPETAEVVPETTSTNPTEASDRVPSSGENAEATPSVTNSDVTPFQVGETVPTDQIKDPTSAEGTMDKVVEQLDKQKVKEYVAPPTYEELGRGLVYNCKGKHWACVDKDAYFICRDNLKWNTGHSKPKECATINVYATNEDCELIQLHNINTREKTDFCK